MIGDFDLDDMSNLEQWVSELNIKIELILVKRLEALLQAWVEEFRSFEQKGGTLIRNPMRLDVKLSNRTIILDPPLSEARAYWYKEAHNQVAIICGLVRVDLTRSAVSTEKTYSSLIFKMSEKFNMKVAYSVLEQVFDEAAEYYETWKSYQALWDIEQN